MLCAAVAELREGRSWRYEIKLDGYWALALKSGDRARLFSRSGKDLSSRFAAVVRALARIPDQTLIDGEIVAIDGDGLADLNRLQNFDADPEPSNSMPSICRSSRIRLRSKPHDARRSGAGIQLVAVTRDVATNLRRNASAYNA